MRRLPIHYIKRNATLVDSLPAPNFPESELLPLPSDITSALDLALEAPQINGGKTFAKTIADKPQPYTRLPSTFWV